jgi:hypothetical protein
VSVASESCLVVIAAAELLPALRERMAIAGSELLAFSDADALAALEAITSRQPHIVALERVFAATPRGAALINRIKADPALVGSEIRVVSHDSGYTRVSPRKPVEPTEIGQVPGAAAVPAPAAVAAPAQALDQRGTRRARRTRIGGPVGVLVDGNAATLVDLSTIGAQVVSSAVLKPNQRVRMALNDDHGSVRFNAAVAWASFEIPPKSGPRYRAGIEFVDADAESLEGFCHRHKAS